MAEIFEIKDKLRLEWDEWVANRPEVIRILCGRFPPNKLYRMKSNGKRVTIYSYSEDGTVTVDITGEYNFLMFARRVFGIDPDDIEECDIPASDEITGTVFTETADVCNYIDKLKEGHK